MEKDFASDSVSAANIIHTATNDSKLRRGTSFPLGATVQAGGVNFSVFSKNATLVELLLFDSADDCAPGTRHPSGSADSSHLSLLARLCPRT